ncbi:PHP domain protein [[Clostridium] ultunense Esp]|uniref:PHP domain protein n=1 Tax=[Clostridium] ultunense Esp TaxID=1288971 RepID=M1ZHG1_9FIRM|nr:PHP domain-containing protein [Schnuerera ultunensis]CCQ97959.1 PHP domain protein [[Clostridium] ultunense Esp]SHD75626.1 PHP domain protein [[Clostridium] ultunense Esp]
MKITGDYHTHTIYSHGKGTIAENVETAIKKGLKEIAICDHGPAHYLYGVRKNQLFKMKEEIDRLNEEYKNKGIRILLGVEANVIGYDGTIDVDDDILNIIDILLLGYHYGVTPKSFKDGLFMYMINPLSKILPICRERIIEKNTEALIKAINKYPVDIITHPDSKAKLNIEKIGEAAFEKGVALEINSNHSQLSIENIKIALKTGVDFCINSDAHDPKNVGNVEDGIKRAKKANIPIDRIRNLID